MQVLDISVQDLIPKVLSILIQQVQYFLRVLFKILYLYCLWLLLLNSNLLNCKAVFWILGYLQVALPWRAVKIHRPSKYLVHIPRCNTIYGS